MTATSQAAETVQENIANVEQGATQTTLSSNEVLGAVDALNQQAELLRTKVHDFLETVKAA